MTDFTNFVRAFTNAGITFKTYTGAGYIYDPYEHDVERSQWIEDLDHDFLYKFFEEKLERVFNLAD